MQTSGACDISLKEEVSRRALTTRNNTSSNRPYPNERDDRYYTYDCDDGEYDDERYERFRSRRAYRGENDQRLNPRRNGVRRRQEDDASHLVLEDIQHTLSISLNESFTGVSVPITITRNVNGRPEEAKLYVDIPAGTDNGEIIILEGKGNIDADLRMRSHVRVRVAVDRDGLFRRDGLNIVCSLEITLKEALCGFRKEITHLDGGHIWWPARRKGNWTAGRRVIPRKGFQRGQSVGNLVIVFHIAMPKTLTGNQIEVLEKALP